MYRFWFAFWTASALTVIWTRYAWMLRYYEWVSTILGIIAVVLAVSIVRVARPRVVSLGFVALGLFVGQWWLVESLLMQLVWSLRGFAP